MYFRWLIEGERRIRRIIGDGIFPSRTGLLSAHAGSIQKAAPKREDSTFSLGFCRHSEHQLCKWPAPMRVYKFIHQEATKRTTISQTNSTSKGAASSQSRSIPAPCINTNIITPSPLHFFMLWTQRTLRAFPSIMLKGYESSFIDI